MANNTTFQYIVKDSEAIVSGGDIVAEGATLQQLTLTGGTFDMNEDTPVTVLEPNVTAKSSIVVTLQTVGGTPAAFTISDITPGTGFEVTGTTGDTSTYTYLVIG